MTYPGFNSPDVPTRTVVCFQAKGFKQSVPGVLYRGDELAKGLPLGGLGTGYIELCGDGTMGDTTIFNHYPYAYTMGKLYQLDSAFLSVTLGDQVRLLATNNGGRNTPGATNIAYWGHFPIAELAYTIDLPLAVTLRAWSPFVLGDAEASNLPAAVFELTLKNTSDQTLEPDVSFHFPAWDWCEKKERFEVEPLSGLVRGVHVSAPRFGARFGYAVALQGDDNCRILPSGSRDANSYTENNGPGVSVIARCVLEPGQEKRITFTLTWFFPSFVVGQAFPYHHMYGRRFQSAEDVAAYMAEHADDLLERILAWQNAVYSHSQPNWLKDALINALYCLTKNSWWNHNPRQDDRWGEDGLFTVNETFRDCPVTETVPCRFFGHFPLLFFYPELERTTLRELAHYQNRSGEIPFALAYGSGLNDPRYQCVHPSNSSMFVQMVKQYIDRTGDNDFLTEMYPVIQAAVRYTRSLDINQDGLVNEHSHALPGLLWPANNYHDAFPWYGTSAHTAGIWLASLLAAQDLAHMIGDHEFEAECKDVFERGLKAYHDLLWTGSYYRLYNDPESGPCNALLSNQLIGVWCAHLLSLPKPLPAENVRLALETIWRLNVAGDGSTLMPVDTVDEIGNPVSPISGDDSPVEAQQSSSCMVSEIMCLAMTLAYEGQEEKGLELARRIFEAHALDHCTPWDQYYLLNTRDGSPAWGNDYYSNLITWAFPASLAGQSIREYCTEGLINECLKATGRR